MTHHQQVTILKNTYPFLNGPDLQELMSIGRYFKLKNKSKIIKAGKNERFTFFILKGMVRGYYINPKGDEKNVFLRPEYTMSGAPDALLSKSSTKYTFETILETHLLLFPFETLQALIFSHPNILQLYINGLHENLLTLIFRVESLIDKLPEERYEELLERSPQFFQKAFNKHIANYLGVSAVSLSRIIKRRKNRSQEI